MMMPAPTASSLGARSSTVTGSPRLTSSRASESPPMPPPTTSVLNIGGDCTVLTGRMPEPRVFLDYTQAELDHAYDQQHWAPTRDETLARYAAASAAARARLAHHAAMPYGATPD